MSCWFVPWVELHGFISVPFTLIGPIGKAPSLYFLKGKIHTDEGLSLAFNPKGGDKCLQKELINK